MQQIATITWMNLRNLPARAGAAAVAMLGFAGVVLVLVAVLAMANGFRATLAQVGSEDVAVVTRAGSNDELSSSLSADTVNILSNAPGIQTIAGQPMVAAELFVTLDLAKRSTGTWANVPLRGTSAVGPKLRPQFKITAGRMFEPGRDEIIVGVGAARTFAGLDLGGAIESGNAHWQIVGVFSDGGSVTESEVWTDARGLQSAYNRGSVFQTVRVKLGSAADFNVFRDALTTDRRLNVNPKTERDFMASQAAVLTNVITYAGFTIGVLMGIGALFGALNTMYSAVATRAREIATLRALGFGGLPILTSVVAESLLLASVGGLLGGLIAYGIFNGYQASTLNFQSFSQVTFAFAVTPELLLNGVVYALLLGLLGGIFPAFRAVRQSIVQGLRAV
jgi:putative ABC transport system permease protein